MLKQQDRDLCVEVSKELREKMIKAIDRCQYLEASRLGKLLDDFCNFAGYLENKEEVL